MQRMNWLVLMVAVVFALGCGKGQEGKGSSGKDGKKKGEEAVKGKEAVKPATATATEKDKEAVKPATATATEKDEVIDGGEIKVSAGEFLDEYNQGYAKRDIANNLAYWKAANSGKEEDFDAYAATELALKTFHSDSESYSQIELLLKDKEKISPLELRSLEVAYLKFKGNQLSPEVLKELVDASTDIEKTFNTFRPEYDGKKVTNNDLLEGISKETDSSIREAMWKALKQVGEAVGGKLAALAHKRNAAAKTLGYKNFWEMQIKLQDHDPDLLVTLFDDLAIATDGPFKNMKAQLDAELARRFSITPEQMMPWHYDNPFFQQAPPSEKVDINIFYKHMKKEDIVDLGGKFFEDIGLDADDIIARSDFYEREGKDQHAFCMSVDRAGDVRMLLNVKPTAEWMDTMLHETGHAVYDKYIASELPFVLRDAAHILTTEGIAMLCGALAKNPTWLVGYAGADQTKVDELKAAILEQRKREQLIFARWVLVMFNFEKALYENPDQDLNTLWWDMVERYQMLTRPPERNLADWASKPHFTIVPVYYHNYQLGELFGAQLRSAIAVRAGHTEATSTLDFVGKKDIGRFLIDEVFKPGCSIPWPEFVEKSTGKPLAIKSFIAEVQ